MKKAAFTTIYTKALLTVKATQPHPNFSHLLNCYCNTIGAENKETSHLLKKVSFYKFRAYMQQVKGVYNWNSWYMDNRATPAFNEAVAEYINHTEQRTAPYKVNDGTTLYSLTQQIESTTTKLTA